MDQRPVVDADRDFLLRLYASTREQEFAPLALDEKQMAKLVRMQFQAQDSSYQKQFPHASFQIIESDSQPIGRLYVDWGDAEVRIIDISLLPDWRGRRIGGALLSEILEDAARLGKPVALHVEKRNPARRLYHRLGFVEIEDQGVHVLMRRPAPPQ